jgi:hypothetical protein
LRLLVGCGYFVEETVTDIAFWCIRRMGLCYLWLALRLSGVDVGWLIGLLWLLLLMIVLWLFHIGLSLTDAVFFCLGIGTASVSVASAVFLFFF